MSLREGARLIGRGRRESTPFFLHAGVFGVVGGFAAFLILIAMLVWKFG